MNPSTKSQRANVILELIKSERDYLKNLKDVTEGYLFPARRHPDIFTIERINTIFSNIEQIYEFQKKFLSTLESTVIWNDPASSQVGRCFLEHQNGFSIYYYYCNNHTNAISELQDLYSQPRFVRFFEACRLLQNMIDISLDGFLLTPIQKICKYPLQLKELLKYTPENHPDFIHVEDALECVKNCANLANERKRRIEALADIMLFQEKFDNWFGPKLSETSSILIHYGEVSKMSSHNWSQGIQLYLFDHLLIYLKKDLLKRNAFVLKGRINMDHVTKILNADDEIKGKKGFKVFDFQQQKWFFFATKNEEEKEEWLHAFKRERKLVEADLDEGFQITKKEIEVAKRSMNSRKHSRSARYRSKKPDTTVVDQLDIDEAATIMNRTLSLPSSIHPGHVMNFVQDSKVISPKRGCHSPIAGNSNLNLTEPHQSQSTTTNWFKKVGSKRIAGNRHNDESEKHAPIEVTYDELQRRHESIMICAERARLYRLNNNLASFDPKLMQHHGNVLKSSFTNAPNQKLYSHSNHNDSASSRSQLNRESNQHRTNFRDSITIDKSNRLTNESQSNSMEATVVLSSGRVVVVKENAV